MQGDDVGGGHLLPPPLLPVHGACAQTALLSMERFLSSRDPQSSNYFTSAHLVVVAFALAALAITLKIARYPHYCCHCSCCPCHWSFVACHPCCHCYCPCHPCHCPLCHPPPALPAPLLLPHLPLLYLLPAILIAVAIALAALANALFVARHLGTMAIAPVVAIAITFVPIICLQSLSLLPSLLLP
jgi:hypothetical protein